MKVRNGFVSNSSSTSFLIVGANKHHDPRLAELAVADKWEEGFGGYHTGKTLVFLGNDYDYGSADEEPIAFQPYYVGIDAEEGIRNGRTIHELRDEFIKKAAALGITFRPEEVDLHYGEVSSE